MEPFFISVGDMVEIGGRFRTVRLITQEDDHIMLVLEDGETVRPRDVERVQRRVINMNDYRSQFGIH